ncbi:MAG TPA: hypothetical protein VEK06_03065, partial [Myxococcota bacterium]|nr:hypothetical protein [Myxococcota bacterium]
EIDALKKALSPYAVVLKIEKPQPGEAVPVKLKNPPAFRAFEAIVRAFTGISYEERDKTPLVFLLFGFFGSLCLLDAGYGLLLFIAGYIVAIKKHKEFGQVFMWTGAFSTVLGILCGQFFGLVFGQDIFKSWPPILSLATDPLVCFKFSLLVGLAVMGLSYVVALVQNGLKSNALGSFFGVLALSVMVLIKSDVIDTNIGVPLALTAAGLMIISWLIAPEKVFGEKSKVANIVWTLYSGPVGLIQDIMSHMRLFGIALSGAILALVINKIASMLPLIFGAFFAVAGHFFVFLLALLSLYIHSNRLIFLEFGGKCMSGGNNYFSPFSRSKS